MDGQNAMEMKDIQKVSLDILKFVSSICEREGIRYCLMYGTLIGAVRHKGFIPWDDDIDIMMPRPDYDKFLEYCTNHKDELGIYEVFNYNTKKDYIYGITRVCDTRYEIVKEETSENCGMGIFIDVYPYDGLGNDKEEALNLLSKTRVYCDTIIGMTRNDQSIPSTLNYKGKVIYFINQIINRFRGVRYYLEKLNSLKGDYMYEDSLYVGPLMWYFSKPHKILFPKKWFDEMIKVPFEDGMFNVPKAYDELLTQEYGNYMELPPVEKRIYKHQYMAYKK